MRLFSRVIVFLTVYLSTFLFVAFWKMHFLHGSVEEFLHLKMMNELSQRRRSFSFLIKPTNIDPVIPRSQLLKEYDLRWSVVVFVKSHTAHHSRRMLARMTWAAFEYLDGIRIETIFIIGKAENEKEQVEIEEENKKHGDILQLDLKEKYSNVGLKTLAGMQYAATHFPDEWMYITIDDDIMPDLMRFLDELDKMRKARTESVEPSKNVNNECDEHPSILCGFGCIVNPQPKREEDSKWYIEEKEYPLVIYPTYCLGGLYGMSIKLVKELYNLSRTLPFFWIDDVWITGFLRLRRFVNSNPKCKLLDVNVGLWSISEDALSVTGTEHELLEEWTKHAAIIHEKKFVHVNDNVRRNHNNHLPFEFYAWLEYVFREEP